MEESVSGVMRVLPETGLLRIGVRLLGDGAAWVRGPGRGSPDGFPPLPHPLTVLAPTEAGSRWVVGRPVGDFRRYRMAHVAALQTLVLDGARAGRRGPDMERRWHEIGRLLAVLHGTPATPPLTPPRALRRARRWLDGASPTVGLFRQRVGAARVRTIVRTATPQPGRVVPVHGLLGLDQCSFGRWGPIDVILGEDVGGAPPEFDFGELAANLLQLSLLVPGVARGLDPDVALHEVRAGYARPLDAEALRLATAVALLRRLGDQDRYVAGAGRFVDVWADLVCAVLDGELVLGTGAGEGVTASPAPRPAPRPGTGSGRRAWS